MNNYKNYVPAMLKDTKISDKFWSPYLDLVREVVLPYQWEALNDNIPDADPSYAIRNLKIIAGEAEGEFGGMVFQDSDLGKWLEAVGFSLAIKPDEGLEKLADSMIELLEKSQQPDGYLNTYFTLKEPGKRWTNLGECHELYSAGHLIEGAVAYYNATGKRKVLDIFCKYADYIDSVFGLEPGKLQGYDGHEEIELALVKLYEITKNEKYLSLSKYFIDERGKEPHYFDKEWESRGKTSHWTGDKVTEKPNKAYTQAHLPVREQREAVGHAVRAVYLYTGMADIARETGDKKLLEACQTLWQDITDKKMYITGGIGSTNHGEAFTFAYDLPNDTVYAETCASIGLIFFAHRMLQIEAKACYADIIERVLYNILISSMALDGRHFFYVNPLEVWPEASEKNPSRHHVMAKRQKWFGCACCPPNVARLLSSLGQYIYTSNKDTIYTHLYIAGEYTTSINNEEIKIIQSNDYPWDGAIKIKVSTKNTVNFRLGIRIPGWCRKHLIKLNGTPAEVLYKDGYAILNRQWQEGDEIHLELEMPVDLMYAKQEVRANAGKAAIQRGPIVYCIEEVDNEASLSALSLPKEVQFETRRDETLAGSPIVIETSALRLKDRSSNASLYTINKAEESEVVLKAIPYYLWGNRKPGEMLVWIRKN